MRALPLVVVVLAAVGCGDEDPVPLSEYVDRANAICRENNTDGRAEIAGLMEQLEADGELDRDEVQDVNRRVLEIARESVDRLAEIPPPDERSADAEAYEQRVRDANEAFDDMIEAIEEGDTQRSEEAFDRSEALDEDVKKAAGDLGLDECAE